MRKYLISYFTSDGDDDEIVVKAESKEDAVKLLKGEESTICEIQSIEIL